MIGINTVYYKYLYGGIGMGYINNFATKNGLISTMFLGVNF